MKFAGYAKSSKPVDELMTDEQLDHRRRHAWREFKSTMDTAIVAANKEVLGKIPLTRESFLRLALTVAELRAAYMQCGLEAAKHRRPTPDQLECLVATRSAYEEASAVFEALERVIERGYVDIPKA